MSNEELARIYLKVNSIYSGSLFLKTIYNRIINANVNIAEFYKQHGSLSNCPVSGLGFGKLAKTCVTKRILELILENGEHVAYEMISKEREVLCYVKVLSSPRRVCDMDIDDDDSFYNTYKKIYD